MSEIFDVKGSIVYTDQGATATLDKVTKAVSDHGGAAEKTATQVMASGEAAKQATLGVGQFGSSVGLAGQAVSRLNPALGGLVTMAGSSLGAIQSLTTAGMGPLGLAVAGVSLAVSAATALYKIYSDEQAKAAENTRDTTDALDDQKKSIDDIIGSITKLNQQMALDSRTRIGAGSVVEQIAASGVAAAHLDEVLSRIEAHRATGAVDSIALSRELTAAQNAYNEALANEASAKEIANQITLEGEDPGPTTDRRSRRAAGPDRADADAARRSALDSAGREQESADRLARLTDDMDAEAEVRRMMREEDIAGSNAAKDRAIANEEARAAGIQRAILKESEARKKAAKTEDDILKVTAGAHTLLAGVIEATAGSSAKAQKAKTQALAAATMVESGIQAAVEVAKAIASYPFDPVGIATHTLAAAAFTAAAIKAAGEAGGGGGGASGGGGAPATATPGGGPALSSGAQERGGDTVVINIGSKGMVYASDKAQLFRDIDEGISQSRSRLGRSG